LLTYPEFPRASGVEDRRLRAKYDLMNVEIDSIAQNFEIDEVAILATSCFI